MLYYYIFFFSLECFKLLLNSVIDSNCKIIISLHFDLLYLTYNDFHLKILCGH